MRRYAVIHRSQSKHGCQWHVEKWHRENEWGVDTDAGKIAIGYHYLVLNAHPWGVREQPEFDGEVVPGRPLDVHGAHTKGYNRHIGICYIGMSPTAAQIQGMLYLCQKLKNQRTIVGVYGHDDILRRQGKRPKGCPGFDMDAFRKMLR